MSVLYLAACGILNYPEYVRQLLTVAIKICLNGEQSARRDARAERAVAVTMASKTHGRT